VCDHWSHDGERVDIVTHIMDETQALDALSNLLNDLSQKPYDISLHVQHIRLAESTKELESQVHTARDMFVNFVAAGDDVWIPLIEGKENSVDLDSKDGLEEILALYMRAEEDYLCAY
jgi:squamous cell carcinoma antigen recognized by T-cells 3